MNDRTRYDVKVAKISDYLILHGQLKNLAIKCINALAHDDWTDDALSTLRRLVMMLGTADELAAAFVEAPRPDM